MYIANKIRSAEHKLNLRSSYGLVEKPSLKLNQSREGFIYRAITLYNKLDDEVKLCHNLNHFKNEARKWIKRNIPVKPQDDPGC